MENIDVKSGCRHYKHYKHDMDKLFTYCMMYSEAGILDEMVDLFCHLACNLKYSRKPIDKKAKILKKMMCGFSAKEKAIAEVIMGAARKNAADCGLDPSEVCCKCCGKIKQECSGECKHRYKIGC